MSNKTNLKTKYCKNLSSLQEVESVYKSMMTLDPVVPHKLFFLKVNLGDI